MKASILGFAYDCNDADALADFYVKLLGWEKTLSGGGWAGISTPQGLMLAFQTVEEYTPPSLAMESRRTAADGSHGL